MKPLTSSLLFLISALFASGHVDAEVRLDGPDNCVTVSAETPDEVSAGGHSSFTLCCAEGEVPVGVTLSGNGFCMSESDFLPDSGGGGSGGGGGGGNGGAGGAPPDPTAPEDEEIPCSAHLGKTELDCASDYAVRIAQIMMDEATCRNEDAWKVAEQICEIFNIMPDGTSFEPDVYPDTCTYKSVSYGVMYTPTTNCLSQCISGWAAGESAALGVSTVSLGLSPTSASIGVSFETLDAVGGLQGACEVEAAQDELSAGLELLECRDCVETAGGEEMERVAEGEPADRSAEEVLL